MTSPALDGSECAAWQALEALGRELAHQPLSVLFSADSARHAHFSRTAAGLLFDFSRQRVTERVLASFSALADQLGLRQRINAMFNGVPINVTEGRAVLHTALRATGSQPIMVGGQDLSEEVRAEREHMLEFAEGVREGRIRSSSGSLFNLIVNIGIGGSDLGPAMAVEALRPYTAGAPRVVFVSNVDGCRLADTLAEADPKRTLFIVCSKTFTTMETLANARTARAWIADNLGEAAVPQHFAAVSANVKAMDAFGVHPEYRFAMWDWVGGRYSIWSSIGVSLAIAIGREGFKAFLVGGAEIDEHFRSAPWDANLPVLAGMLGVWNVDVLALPTLAILPYDERLARLPAYLQQLEMESNGKSVRVDGTPVTLPTCPVIWGEPGNNAQHSFFQLLHQGTLRAALDFLLPVNSSCGNQPQQDLAIASCLAQAEAFAFGHSAEQVNTELEAQGLSPERIAALTPHKMHAGNRPSTLVMFERLDPRTLGRLIALYEHKVFVQSVVWGINAFDQWGVELGKKMCEAIVPLVHEPEQARGVTSSLRGALGAVAQWRRAGRMNMS
jgi:glucose-6-phosphate isomerase